MCCVFLQGRYIAKNPIIVILVSAALWAVLAAGLKWLKVETNPQNLWTPKDSRSVREQQAYNDAFGPFFRTETLILSTKKDPKTGDRPSIVTKENIDLLFEMQEVVDKVVGKFCHTESHFISCKLPGHCYGLVNLERGMSFGLVSCGLSFFRFDFCVIVYAGWFVYQA